MRLVDQKFGMVFQTSNTHILSNDKLEELRTKSYVLGDNKFGIDYESKKTVCRTCGEIKSFDKFRYHRKKLAFRCLKCGSKKAKDKYDNLSPEEYEKYLVQAKTWRRTNNDKCRGYERAPKARANRNVRTRLKKFLKEAKDHHFSKGIGCTKKELNQHLESQFTEGMSWGNYGSGENGDHVGSWHIDHIIPISKFKGEFPNHYTNLQPMWGMDNMKKGNKIE
jgi:hypothetical protein